MLGRDDLAVRYFEQATRTEPGNAATFFDLGFVHDRQNQKERGDRGFEKAVALKPDARPRLVRAWASRTRSWAATTRRPRRSSAPPSCSR